MGEDAAHISCWKKCSFPLPSLHLFLTTNTLSSSDLQDPAWSAVFKASEVIFCSIFLLEYVLRVYVCTEKAVFAHPVLGRLRYVLTTSAQIFSLDSDQFYRSVYGSPSSPSLVSIYSDLGPFKYFNLFTWRGLSDYFQYLVLINLAPWIPLIFF